LVAQGPIIGRDPDAEEGVGAAAHLIDEVTDGQGMGLGRTEHQGLLILVHLLHEDLHPVGFPLLDLDDPVEVRLGVPLSFLDLPFDQDVIRGIDVLIQGRGDLFDLEGGQEAIIDSFLQGIDEHRLPEVGVPSGLILPLV